MKNQLRSLRYTSWSVFIILMLIACADAADQKSDETADTDPVITELRALEKAVIDVHDEVMPKMANLNNTRVKLSKQNEDENLSDDQHTILRNAILHLEEADSLMWDWMHNYSRPDYDGNLDSAQAYLEKEKVTVLKMKGKFLSSMTEGEALLTKKGGNEN